MRSVSEFFSADLLGQGLLRSDEFRRVAEIRRPTSEGEECVKSDNVTVEIGKRSPPETCIQARIRSAASSLLWSQPPKFPR